MSDAPSSTAATGQKAYQERKHHTHNPVKRSVGLAGAITGDVAEFLGGKKNPAGGSVNAVAKGLNKAAGKGAQT
ncbi:hypothetical protein PG996_009412 [Apiospora saccharicola]|uniref:Uncharacterized protein n=1 Tax=Apiospora saccharicola TaxID=335842 RepID=A0ABR1ULA6_9PEZI